MYQENIHVRRFLNKDQTADSIMGTDIESMVNSYMTEYFVTLYVPKANIVKFGEHYNMAYKLLIVEDEKENATGIIVKDDEDYNMKLFVNGRDMSDNLGYFEEE